MTAFDFDALNRESLLYGADAFSDKEEAADHLDGRIRFLESLDPIITLYRVVILESINDLRIDELGQHWTNDEDVLDEHMIDYLKFECNGEEIPGKPYLLKAEFPVSCIDIEMTLAQNLLNPHEEELFLSRQVPVGPLLIKPHGADRYARFSQNSHRQEESLSI